MEFLDRLFRFPVEQLPFFLTALVIAFTVHEFAHAYFANRFGDPTAKLLGRVTLNPAVHFDFLGVLMLLIAGFGWARPVPVNRDNFSNPRLMGIIVSAAGPISNLLLGIIGTLIYAALFHFGVMNSLWLDSEPTKLAQAISAFFYYFNLMNFFLFLFNLIPLPPLDGYRIIEDLAPRSMLGRLQQFERWAIFVFLLILFVPQLQRYTITPLYDAASSMYLRLFHLVSG
ncbi:site-2 protease family protein [Paenibacillus sp. YPG26]|uniref:site-2 protease family protein n=1 Tax=Paenibacillus sp. YPG26 TaxID=2878915 RepID=UPI00203BA147|nr:site-2 protease family protein [Paenibacillus sp. YPG26]USB34438.1 site-2 protease family protein [Paenibacillus sp. YPG26]